MTEEKQIEEMSHFLCGNYDTERGTCCEDAICDNDCWGYRAAKDLHDKGYRKQEWISVEKRLPNLDPYGKGRYGGKRSVRVLCACKQKDGRSFVKEGYYEPYGDGFARWRIPGSIDSVTHWMPLPEPPKMKGGAE